MSLLERYTPRRYDDAGSRPARDISGTCRRVDRPSFALSREVLATLFFLDATGIQPLYFPVQTKCSIQMLNFFSLKGFIDLYVSLLHYFSPAPQM